MKEPQEKAPFPVITGCDESRQKNEAGTQKPEDRLQYSQGAPGRPNDPK